MHFLRIKLKDLSLPKVRCILASVFELKGKSNILATESSAEKSRIGSENVSIKDNQSLVILFSTDEIVNTVDELTTACCNNIRLVSLVLVTKFQCLLADARNNITLIINCHGHLRINGRIYDKR